MPKFKIEFTFDADVLSGRKSRSREAELPSERNAFHTALLNLENDLYEEYREEYHDSFVYVITIAALEDISAPSIKPDTSPIQQGDIVWRDWDTLCTNGFDPATIKTLVDEYKPLWEAGPGYDYLMELMAEK